MARSTFAASLLACMLVADACSGGSVGAPGNVGEQPTVASASTASAPPEAPYDLSVDGGVAITGCDPTLPADTVCLPTRFHWYQPIGDVDGWYLTAVKASSPEPVATCKGPSAVTVPPDLTHSYQVDNMMYTVYTPSNDHLTSAWICAYNSAGVSPLAKFP
jgi:hypothetical protein